MGRFRRDRSSLPSGLRNPITPQDKLFQTFVDTLRDSGVSVTPRSDPASSPQRIVVERNGECTDVLSYLRPIYRTAPKPGDPAPQWGPKRIRLGFKSEERNTIGQTVVLGHDAEANIFVGIDPDAYLKVGLDQRYAYPDQKMMWSADEHGFSASKQDGYVMFAVQAHHLASYVVEASRLHADAMDLFVLDLYRKTPTLTMMPWDDIEKVSWDRRERVKKKVEGILIDKFRESVRRAYRRKCAVTGIDVGCISHAAHIYPKSEPDTSYDVSNGILLRPDLHAAFDRSIVYLDFIKGKGGDPECRMLFNGLLRDKLKAAGSAGGIEEFEKYHLSEIRKTNHPHELPNKDMIEKAIEFHDVFMKRGKKKKGMRR
jgi:putative restriction endonuclease